jgi:alpha-D-ribose 1-methylphosphonate 5-triphosphate synthase subunit PhnH
MQTLAAGFNSPVFDSQVAFRAVMRALSRPGTIEPVPVALVPPAPLHASAAAVVLSMADFESPVWISPSLAAVGGVADYIRFHTGAPLATAPDRAMFALLDLRADTLDLADFAQGTAEYPDRSTTIILLCDSLDDGEPLHLTGPGLQGEGAIAFSPHPAGFTEQWQRNRAGFPLGVDLVLTAGDRIAALPRSTRITRRAA